MAAVVWACGWRWSGAGWAVHGCYHKGAHRAFIVPLGTLDLPRVPHVFSNGGAITLENALSDIKAVY